jgi:very-short-patch-repair endonuclease
MNRPPLEAAQSAERARLVAKSVKTWTGDLVDLGGRNTLLYYRDLKQGTLDLSPDSPANDVAVDELLGGRTIRLSNLFDDTSLSSAARRARTVKAKENFEERGLLTTFLAWGMATWTNTRGAATPAAPVLLRQAALTARGGAGEDFDVTLPGEWEVNPTLLHLLKTEYQIEVSGPDLLELLDQDAEPPEAIEVFAAVAKVGATAVPGFGVAPRLVLGNFSYAKLPMVMDMEAATDALVSSELICAIAGDDLARAAVRARHPEVSISEPDVVPPKDEFLVLDADASQSYAINAAAGGADLIIDGPPGTGKSQTIANLIATLSARGRRILFVAEKRAAIGELVLDLHEGTGSKRKLAVDLSRALAGIGSLPRPDMTPSQDSLVRRREALVGRVDALHAPRPPWGITVYEAQTRLLGVPRAATSGQRLRGETLARLDGGAFRSAQAALEDFVGLGGLGVSEATTPWSAAFFAGTITTPQAAQSALDAATTLANHTLPEATSRFQRALAECGLTPPTKVGSWIRVLTLLDGVASTLAVFDPSVFDAPLAELTAALTPSSKGVLGRFRAKLLDAQYRRARKAALALWKADKPKPSELHAAVAAAAAQADVWRSGSADGGRPRLPADLGGAEGVYSQLLTELQGLELLLGITDLAEMSLASLRARMAALLADTPTLSKLPELTRHRSDLHNAGLGPLLAEMATRNLTLDQALACLEQVWLSSILETVSVADPRIGAFDGDAHRRIVGEYRAADRSHIESAVVRVRRAVAESATKARDDFPKESDVIEHQARLKRGHLPVRQLFQAAPHVLGALKPCWAMSPLVVSQLLPAQRCFDVVIFDEASQVTPADAVGALMRADHAIVAGDPHQLPPTSFFGTSGGGQDDEDLEAEELSSSAGTRNMESVLDAMGSLLPPPKGTRTLGWHYRSRDERLIAFSNAQSDLYDWALTTFPGVAGGNCIRHVAVPFRSGRLGQEDSVADEVAEVVDLVADHASSRSHQSLGVIAMGIKHANRVEEALRRSRADDPQLDAFMDGTASPQALREPFFVKNLERVQGDERDAIILTVGYGKNPDGRMLYRFGPINNEGGERRLNVAITRARAQMTVVSSFTSADMDPNKLRSQGAQMLCRYLAYAESGGSDLGPVAKGKPDLNPFERDVEMHLQAAGIPLVAQYGCSGYWIDYAAQHPTRRGQMVLAIECDGVSYHSSATARDRDRLRQEHLERLGWTFHRIWSQDWFYHREREVQRVVEAYEAAVVAADRAGQSVEVAGGPEVQPALDSDDPVGQTTGPAAPRRLGPCPVGASRPGGITAYSRGELIATVRWIESDTLLRTEEELVAETMRVLGFIRRGAKITSAITAAIQQARTSAKGG